LYYILCNTSKEVVKIAIYPDWVMEHKKKGTYINKVGDKYYLYAAHSERIKDTDKVRRVFDSYLGRITEKDGLIPPKGKISGDILSYEYGMSYVALECTKNIHAGLRRSFARNGDLIYACSILSYIYGFHSRELFLHTYLCIHFRDLAYPESFTPAQLTGIGRGERMLHETLGKLFGDETPSVRASFSLLRLVNVNGQYHISKIPGSVISYCEEYSISMEGILSWKK
jgi:hypothetical protein